MRFVLPSFLFGWFASAAVTVFLPLLIFMIARLTYDPYQYGDGEQQDENDQNGNYSYCSWWNFRCKNRYRNYRNNNNNNSGDGQGEQDQTPWWWLWGEEGEGRRREDEGRGALLFIYIWSLLVFAGILFYGFQVLRRGLLATHGAALMAVLIIFGNMSFLSMIFLGGLEGGVGTEGRELEEEGFYGQIPVLMFLTNLFWTIFCTVYVFLLRHQIRHANVTKLEYGTENEQSTDYQLTHDEPEVRTTDKETV